VKNQYIIYIFYSFRYSLKYIS